VYCSGYRESFALATQTMISSDLGYVGEEPKVFAGGIVAEENIIIQCNKCGAKNRIPGNRINDRPICGRCHDIIPITDMYDRPVDVTDNTFNEKVILHSGPVLVDCWAPWCGPCRMIAPILEQLAKEYAGKAIIAKLNVDENPLTASKYSVQSIPTMLLFRDGKLVNTLVGAIPKQNIEEHIRAII